MDIYQVAMYPVIIISLICTLIFVYLNSEGNFDTYKSFVCNHPIWFKFTCVFSFLFLLILLAGFYLLVDFLDPTGFWLCQLLGVMILVGVFLSFSKFYSVMKENEELKDKIKELDK